MATRSKKDGHQLTTDQTEDKSVEEEGSSQDHSKSPKQVGDTDQEKTKTSSPEPNCAICLGKLENKSFTDSCFHTFCFVCLLEWSKVQAVCPLCKQPFKSIIHNVRSFEDYDQYHLKHDETAAAEMENRRFRFHSTMTSERWWEQQRREQERQMALLQRPTRLTIASQWRRQRQAPTSAYRRRVYANQMRVTEVRTATGRTMRYREVSPEFYRQNPACTHRLVPWLNRELNVLLTNQEDHVQFVMELILDLIKRFDIQSEEFFQHIQPFTGRRTEHFVHEFYSFARSPYDMFAYDQRAIYEEPAEQPVHTIESSDDSSSQSDDAHIIEHIDDNDDVIVVSPQDGPGTLADEVTTSQDHPYSSMFSGQPDLPTSMSQFPIDFDLTPLFQRVQSFLSAVDYHLPGPSGIDNPRPGPSSAWLSQEGSSSEPINLDPPANDDDITPQLPPPPPPPLPPELPSAAVNPPAPPPPLPSPPPQSLEENSCPKNSDNGHSESHSTEPVDGSNPSNMDPAPGTSKEGSSSSTLPVKLDINKIKKEKISSDSDSDTSDVLVIGYTKPWGERSPEALSTEDEMEALAKIEAAKAEDEIYKRQRQERLKQEAKDKSQSRSPSRSRSRSRSRTPRRRRQSHSSSRGHFGRRSRSRTRRSRSRSRQSHSRTRSRRSRSRSKARRSRSRSRIRRSRSRSRSRRSSSKSSRRHRTSKDYYSSRYRHDRRSRSRSLSSRRERSSQMKEKERRRQRESEKDRNKDWERRREKERRRQERSRSNSQDRHRNRDRQQHRRSRSSDSRRNKGVNSNVPKAYQIINSSTSRSRSRSRSVEVVFRRSSKSNHKDKRFYSSRERDTVDLVSPSRKQKKDETEHRQTKNSADNVSQKNSDKLYKKNPTGHKSSKRDTTSNQEPCTSTRHLEAHNEKPQKKKHTQSTKDISNSSATEPLRKKFKHNDETSAVTREHSQVQRAHHVISDDEDGPSHNRRGYSLAVQHVNDDSSDCEVHRSSTSNKSATQVFNYDHSSSHSGARETEYYREEVPPPQDYYRHREDRDNRNTIRDMEHLNREHLLPAHRREHWEEPLSRSSRLEYSLSREELDEVERIAREVTGYRSPRQYRDSYWHTEHYRY